MPVKIQERGTKAIPAKLEIVQTLSKCGEKRVFSKVLQRKNQLLIVYPTHSGIHISVHDADADHQMAGFHEKTFKGEFFEAPGNVALGKSIMKRELPAFSCIRGVCDLPPESANSFSLTPAHSFWQQLKPASQSDSKKMFNLDTDIAHCGYFGSKYMFVEHGNLSSLEEWFDERRSLYTNVSIVVDLFEFFNPWLAIVTLTCDTNYHDRRKGKSE